MNPSGTPNNRTALHAIALFEAVKGVAAIAASVGFVSLAHHNVRAMVYALIGHFHLNPNGHYPGMMLSYADVLVSANLREVVLLAWGYAAIRLTEGYGLWKDRAWAEWLAALSGMVYFPLEVNHLIQDITVINGAVLVSNVAVVAYMVYRLWQRRASTAASTL